MQSNIHTKPTQKNHNIVSLDPGKACDKTQHPLRLKVLETSGFQGPDINILIMISCKATAIIKLNGHTIEGIPLNLGTRQGRALSPYLFNIVFIIPATTITQKTDDGGCKLAREK